MKTAPKHLGIILDGNRRWAEEHGLATLEGHREGYLRLKDITEAAFDRGVEYVSAFVFSTENWSRGKKEVSYIMKLFHWVVTNELENFHKRNLKILFLGTHEGLSKKILEDMKKTEEKTAGNTGGTLVLCLNYGGQQEIADAAAAIARSGIEPDDITPETIAENLYKPGIPPVDMIIRTSGEQRLSGFLLWHSAYAELKFVDKYWPAFTVEDLDEALADYAKRQRRFGS